MTFAELDSASNRLANAIRCRGIGDGGFVGIHLDRSSRYVVSVLAVLKANCAAVPLPPSYPAARLHEILSFAALDAVIDDHETPLAPRLHERVVRFSDVRGTAVLAVRPGGSDHPAFVLCSSGSTGKPKMIVRSHRSFFHRLRWTWETHPYEAGEVCCQKAHMTTTHAVYELFEPLLRGIAVCIIPDQETRSLESFWNTITRRAISRLLLVPSVLNASLDMPGFAPPDIKVLVLMGESVHAGLAARTVAAFPATTKIYSIYGSTEASSVLVCNLRELAQQDDELPLGTPISPDVHACLLGDNLEPVPAGTVGMLYIAGPPLFTGYFKAPELTDAKLVTPTPGGAPLYCTNDRALRMPDGTLRFLGRVDHTVKIRGFRVDLQEVERAIARHRDVGQCAVVAKENADGGAMLVAFVSPATVQAPTVYQVLREQLPAYMVPSDVVGMDAFPLTSSGKVDRHKLLEGYAACIATAEPGRFQSETERNVADVWAAVLGRGAVRSDSNFFEVGGTSLTAFSVVSQLRDAYTLERRQLSDVSLYQFPTVESLAAHIDRMCNGGIACTIPEISPLVTLRPGRDSRASPLFVISSAGGTLGAYEKLVRALETEREVMGVRDPFLWDGRDPTLGFQSWVGLYLAAILGRQPEGPYFLIAYSSAGALGYEIARQLRRAGKEVALLALIDPLAMDRASRWRFGYWALRAKYMRQTFRRMVRFGGWLRRTVPRRSRDHDQATRQNDFVFTPEQFFQIEALARTSQQHILELSVLLELNTGIPFALAREELMRLEPEQYVDVLLAKVHDVAPDIEAKTIEKMVVQYQLQVRSQHRYRLQRYDGKVALFDADGRRPGLLASQFKPYVRRLHVRHVALGSPSEHTRKLSERFTESMRSHYISMRDDTFVNALARELENLLH